MVEDIISCMIPLCLEVIVDHVVDFFDVGLIGSRGINWSVYLKGGEAGSSNQPLFLDCNGETTGLPDFFEWDKSLELESGVRCTKNADAGHQVIHLVRVIPMKYRIKISHQNTHNFDLHFCNWKNSDSPALFDQSRVIGQAYQ